jgi:hypothetical protein
MQFETTEQASAFFEVRDYRSRWRQDRLASLKGDLDDFAKYVRRSMILDSDLMMLRESVDFAKTEGDILTPEMLHAAESALAWGDELRRLLKESLGETA